MCNQAAERFLNEQLSIEDNQFRTGRNQIIATVELEEFNVD